MLFLPRRWRILCFFLVTSWQIGIILTANYTFLNYLVLALGFLLLDDRLLLSLVPQRWKPYLLNQLKADRIDEIRPNDSGEVVPPSLKVHRSSSHPQLAALKFSLTGLMLGWIFYSTTVQMIWIIWPSFKLPTTPIEALDPFRIANRYGLFAVMTRGRYEIEFQGSEDGQRWEAYPFRYKPQDPSQPPGIYAPYQPRFDWNLWFASLGSWREYPIVLSTEIQLLSNDPDVLALFAGNPFAHAPPTQVRAVLWQYWFTTRAEKRNTGLWWRREFLGLYAPAITRDPDGKIRAVEWPTGASKR
jgi:hypothetical protein